MVLPFIKKYLVPPALFFALFTVYLAPPLPAAGAVPASAASGAAAQSGKGLLASNLMSGNVSGSWEDWEVIRDCQSLGSFKGAKLRQLGFSAGGAAFSGGLFFRVSLGTLLCALVLDAPHFVRDKMLSALHDKDGMR